MTKEDLEHTMSNEYDNVSGHKCPDCKTKTLCIVGRNKSTPYIAYTYECQWCGEEWSGNALEIEKRLL